MRPQIFKTGDVALAGLRVSRRGWSTVTFRSVAAELGVSPMALYRVASDAEELRRLIANSAADAIQPVDLGDFDETLKAWAERAHRYLSRFPGLSAFVTAEWKHLPRWLDIVEGLLSAAYNAGLDGPAAVAAANAIFAYVLARVQLREAAGAGRHTLGSVAADSERYPLLRENRSEYAKCEAEKHFSIGLAAIIAGLATVADRLRGASPIPAA
jgi:AcrR family transcriptional regulator